MSAPAPYQAPLQDYRLWPQSNSAWAASIGALLDGSWRQAMREPPPPFDCAMLDIESMSLHPGFALILSVGVLPYRLTPRGPVMGPGLIMVFDLADQLVAGRHVDAGTQGFWSRQPRAASSHFADPAYQPPAGVTLARCPLAQLAPRLRTFLDQHCTRSREIYSQGIAFDVSNLAGAMIDAGHEPPWKYSNVVDARSLRRKLPRRRFAPKLSLPAAAHDPVHDSIKQIWGVWEVATDDMLGIAPLAVAS